jgi:large subunit ribosomal protein L22
MKVDEALKFLKFAPKKGALILYKIVFSAVSNAKNNDGQKSENLIIDMVSVNKGIVYKR